MLSQLPLSSFTHRNFFCSAAVYVFSRRDFFRNGVSVSSRGASTLSAQNLSILGSM